MLSLSAPRQPPQEQFDALLQQHLGQRQRDMMNYTQLQMQAQNIGQQVAYMGNLAAGGLGLGGCFASSGDPLYVPTPYKHKIYPATRKGHRAREWNAVTQKGYRAKERAEITFWVCVTLIGFFAVIVPVAIKAMSFFWTWALT